MELCALKIGLHLLVKLKKTQRVNNATVILSGIKSNGAVRVYRLF